MPDEIRNDAFLNLIDYRQILPGDLVFSQFGMGRVTDVSKQSFDYIPSSGREAVRVSGPDGLARTLVMRTENVFAHTSIYVGRGVKEEFDGDHRALLALW